MRIKKIERKSYDINLVMGAIVNVHASSKEETDLIIIWLSDYITGTFL